LLCTENIRTLLFMNSSYEVTGFQSACAEFAQKPLSLDERYLSNKPSLFIIEAATDSPVLGIQKGDKFLIDRSLKPREGQLVLLVLSNEFKLQRFFRKKLEGQDPETGDFVWGVITTLIREYR
jgi:DNA polymerase V